MRKVAAVYHLASSGGTAISRLLHARYKIVLVNEVHPFHLQRGTFSPSNPVELASQQISFTSSELRKVFDSQMKMLIRRAPARHRVLLRVHSHSDYFADTFEHSSRALDRWIGAALITVREPFANYVSGVRRGFFADVPFEKFLDRYVRFLDDYSALPIFHFESIFMEPETNLSSMSRILRLEPRPVSSESVHTLKISGDNRNVEPVTGDRFMTNVLRNWTKIRNSPDQAELMSTYAAQLASLRTRLGYSGNLEHPL